MDVIEIRKARQTGSGMVKERTLWTRIQLTCKRRDDHHIRQRNEDIDEIVALVGETRHG